MRYFLFLFLITTSFKTLAQDEGLRNSDYTYLPNIKTVKFYVNGILNSYPIITLNADASLVLTFDDMDADAKNYLYTVVHCNAYWEPSNLAEMEYINGFIENQVSNYNYSNTQFSSYTNYQIQLPDNRMSFRKSGNYLLKVYDNQNKKKLALTRRFVVVEPLVRVLPRQLSKPANVSKIQTHQEFDFAINYEGVNIRSPQQEIRAAVLQNGRWDNAILDLSSNLLRINELVFDYQDKVVFPGGREFRFFDMRTLRFRSRNVYSIERTDNSIEVTVQKDKRRSDQIYLQYIDVNGNFVVENEDQRGVDPNTSGEYANVLFSLSTPEPYYDSDIYIFGALTEWQLKPEFKMEYNNAVNGYVAKVPLKQGYYDYAYAAVPRADKTKFPNMGAVEGDWYETENQYTILIYYRSFGGRYDRVIGVASFTSNL